MDMLPGKKARRCVCWKYIRTNRDDCRCKANNEGKKFTVQLILEGFDEDEFNSTPVCKKNFLVPRTLALTATLVINLNGNESVVDFSELSPENMVPLVLKQEKSS